METIIITTMLLAGFLWLRSVLDGKISARLQYSIWLLIAVRLLFVWIPLPGSSVSVMNLVPMVQEHLHFSNQNASREKTEGLGTGSEQKKVDLQADGELLQKDTLSQDETSSQDMAGQKTSVQSEQESLKESETSAMGNGAAAAVLFSITYGIYGIGVGIMLLWMAVKNVRLWNGLRRRRILYEGELPVESLPGRLYLVEHLESPFLFGRHIYVSPEMIGDQQKLHHILVHETCHWKQGDSFWSVLRCFCLAVYWYHPLVWYGVHLSIVDAELACDERAIYMLGDEERFGYGDTLLGLIRSQADFRKCICISTQMSGNKRDTQKRLERIVGQRKRARGRVLFLVVSMLVLCLVTMPGKKVQTDASVEREWKRVEQEGFPCIVVDEQGNIVGTRRGELLRKVVLDYVASDDNSDFHNYQIKEDAFSACPNLKTLILPNQNVFEYVIDYIDPDAFRGCSEDLVVYCDRGNYAWTRLQELEITVKEIPDGDFSWRLLGEDTKALKRIQKKIDSENNNSTLTDREMRQFYGEPFFMMTESGEGFHFICESLSAYTQMAEHKIYLPADAQTLVSIFPQYLMVGRSITIPKNIVEVGDSSFMHCQLSEVTFEEGSKLQTIGSHAFMEENITEIQLPEGLLEIDKYGFAWCRNLIEITIPKSVQRLGSRSFELCGSLERVVILNPDITLEEDVFDNGILNSDSGEDDTDMGNLDSNYNLTIVCHPGSNAEKYAKDHGLLVEYLLE